MKLLTKSYLLKLNTSGCNAEFSLDKLTVLPKSSGRGELNFPLPFSCYKFINVSTSAKKTGEASGTAKIGVSFIRRGQPFGSAGGEQGFTEIGGDAFNRYELHYLIPFGVDEAFVTVELEGGAGVAILELNAEVEFAPKLTDGGLTCIADGGLSGYAPKNSKSAILAAVKAGYKYIAVDADQTSDGVLIAYDGANLSACSDGEGYPGDYTFEQLSALDFGFFANAFYKDTRVAKLSDAIKAMASANVYPVIRITVRNFDFEALRVVLSEHGVEKFAVISPDVTTLEKAYAYFPSARFGYICEELTADRAERLSKLDCFVVSTDVPKNMALAEGYGVELVLIANDEQALRLATEQKCDKILTKYYQLDGCKF